MLTATADGNDEKALRTGPTESFPSDLAWSPNQIAYELFQPSSALGQIDIFDIDAGKAQRLAVFDDKAANELIWSPDGREIFVNYEPKGPNFLHYQIGWLASTPHEY
ncbi:MAG: hypothetical protein WB630_08515 [Candidatus Acidiferrales bacterium]